MTASALIPGLRCNCLALRKQLCQKRLCKPSFTTRNFRKAAANCSLPHYADLPLDRAGHLRKKPSELAELMQSPSASYTLFHKYEGLVALPNGGGDIPEGGYGWLPIPGPFSRLEALADADVGCIFLGLNDKGRPHFALNVTDAGREGVAALLGPSSEGEGKLHGWVELRREAGPRLPSRDAAVYAFGFGLVCFARKNKFDPATGKELKPFQGGHARRAEEGVGGRGPSAVFTRIDPAVIMAVTHGDWILLGRQSRWRPGQFSLLAGFCEVGETLEQAVVRETLEEAAVRVDLGSVRYVSSQPWPFPQSLMLGFQAEATRQPPSPLEGEGADAVARQRISQEEIQRVLGDTPPPPAPDDKELESAYWFHRSFVAAALQGGLPKGVEFCIPGGHALANSVITSWSQETLVQAQVLQEVTDVAIDYGRFKYVLLRISILGEPAHSKLVVRGDRRAEYHDNILKATKNSLGDAYKVEVLGGGRIENDIQNIKVFGFSSAFGAAPHELAAALIQKSYPMSVISHSYSGY